MKVLITGSSSAIGTALSNALLTEGLEVVAFDLEAPRRLDTRCTFVQGDVRNFRAVYEAAKGCSAGIHLAVRANNYPEQEILAVNVLGAFTFFKAASERNFTVSVLASSAPVHLPFTETESDLLLNTAKGDTYDLSKKLQEVIAQDFQLHGLPIVCLRFGHVVRGQAETTLDRGTPLSDLEYCRGGWVALEDIVSACVSALTRDVADRSFKVYNLVGSRGARDRFAVARAERRLGITLAYDFCAFEQSTDT